MTPEQFEKLMQAHREQYKIQKRILEMQERIIDRLDRLVENKETTEPELEKSLSEYKNFDWKTIGAKVIETDMDGVALVEWRGKIYRRRSPDNKFSPAIWYSRKEGDEYKKLITFKTLGSTEPLGRKVINQLNGNI